MMPTMKPGALEVNDLIMVRPQADSLSRAYPSRVEDLQGENVTLAWPSDGGVRVSFRIEESVYLSYTRTDAVYGIQGIVKRTVTEPMALIQVHLVGQVERIQRREYVRVQAILPVEMILSSTVEEGLAPSITKISTKTIDLSAGGMAIHHKAVIPHGTLFDVQLNLPGSSSSLRLLAKVVRDSVFRDAYNEKMHRYGLMFLSVPEGTRSRLVKYVFDAQLKHMRR
jgi:c-di-GMP-binding flagellar brake protein YcgR